MTDSKTMDLGRPSTLADTWQQLPENSADWAEGQQIGPFRLKRMLGRGGMGVVWLAEQLHPLVREVAIKVMRPERRGAKAEAWFEVERQALAQLSHRAIAQIHDAGRLPDGALFYAMEFVPGLPLDVYLREQSLDHPALARLLIELCAGVQHAHQRGLIHRDIKPANILVQRVDGVAMPKLIDFGIAIGAAAGLNAAGSAARMAGTLAYMSPEQLKPDARGVDARTDVYTLGAVLAEGLYLLGNVQTTRAEGFSSSTLRDELEQSLGKAETNVSRPGDRLRLLALCSLPTELRAIAVKAMAVEREQRYDSAAAMAEDLQRWLRHAPVRAMGDGRFYRLRCFVRRHAWATAAALLLALGLTGFAVVMSVQTARISREVARTRQALAELEQVTAFQASQLSAIDPQQMGQRIRNDIEERRRAVLVAQPLAEPVLGAELGLLQTALATVNFTDVASQTLDQTLFEGALRSIETDFATQPLLQARLRQTVAVTLRQLGLLKRAQQVQSLALDQRRALLGNTHPDTLQSIDGLAGVLQDQGDLPGAEVLFVEALDQRRKVLGAEHPDTIDSISNLGLLLHLRGRFDEARPLYQEALEKYRRILGDTDPRTLQALNNMGGLLRDQGQLKEAEPFWRDALQQRRQTLGAEHRDTISSMNSLSSLLMALGQVAEAEPLAVEALEKGRRVLGNEHPDILPLIGNLGFVMRALGRQEETERYYREAMDTSRRVLGPEHPNTLLLASNFGALLREQGKPDAAEPIFREVMQARLRVLGPEHPSTLLTLSNFGDLLREKGDHRAALALLLPAESNARKVFVGGNSFRLGLLLSRIAKAEMATGERSNLDSARTRLLEAHGISSAASGAAHKETLDMAQTLVELYERLHELEPAADHQIQADTWRASIAEAQSAAAIPGN